MVAGVAKESEGAPNKEPAENADSLNVDRIEQLSQEIKLLKHENKDAKQEINLLKESIRVDKRRSVRDDKIHGIERMNRNAEEVEGEQMEEMSKGKIDSISGRQDGMTSLLRQMKELGLPTFSQKFIDFVNGELYHSILYLNKTVDEHRDAIQQERSNTEKLLKKADDSLRTKTSALKSEVDDLKSTVAKQVRCLSGFQKLYYNYQDEIYGGRVTFNPAFSDTPDICFGAFAKSWNDRNIEMMSTSVKSTHVDFKFYQPKSRDTANAHVDASVVSPYVGVQWMACGRSNRGMTAEMLLDLKLNE